MYYSVCNVDQKKVIRIEQDGETYTVLQGLRGTKNYVLLIKRAGPEWWWRKDQRAQVSLVSLEDGSRTLFNKEINYACPEPLFDLSPEEKYIVYFDPFKRGYYSHEILTGITRSITKTISESLEKDQSSYTLWPDPNLGYSRIPVGLAGWTDGDNQVLIYDNHDIWSVDPTGNGDPENITKGYGKTHHIQLRLLTRGSGAIAPGGYARELSEKEAVCLTGFNSKNKYAGIFQLKLDSGEELKLLFAGAYSLNQIKH